MLADPNAASSLTPEQIWALCDELTARHAPLLPAALGGAFHARRLQLVSSQVAMVANSRRARWSHARRSEAAMSLLADDRLDALISEEIAFRDAPTELPKLFAGRFSGLTAALRYQSAS